LGAVFAADIVRALSFFTELYSAVVRSLLAAALRLLGYLRQRCVDRGDGKINCSAAVCRWSILEGTQSLPTAQATPTSLDETPKPHV
jgi:hypothetical protein